MVDNNWIPNPVPVLPMSDKAAFSQIQMQKRGKKASKKLRDNIKDHQCGAKKLKTVGDPTTELMTNYAIDDPSGDQRTDITSRIVQNDDITEYISTYVASDKQKNDPLADSTSGIASNKQMHDPVTDFMTYIARQMTGMLTR